MGIGTDEEVSGGNRKCFLVFIKKPAYVVIKGNTIVEKINKPKF